MSYASRVDASRVGEVVQAAWRRRLLVLALEHLALACVLVLAGVILLLLLGTQILEWYWLALFGVAGLGIAAWRVKQESLAPYRVAQAVDHSLRLSDSLSTAWFLLTRLDQPDDPVTNFQLKQAERIASTVRPATAFPFKGQRSWALAGAFVAVAFGLFALRYLVTSSLSLRQAMVPIHFGEVWERVGQVFGEKKRDQPNSDGSEQADARSPHENEQQRDRGEGQLSSEELKSRKADGDSSNKVPAQPEQIQETGRPEEGQSDNRQGTSLAETSSEKKDQQGSQRADSGEKPGTKEQPGKDQQNTRGLMDKMKDALSSLMAKMRPSNKTQSPNQPRSEDEKATDQASAGKDPNSDQQQNMRDKQSGQEQSAEGQAQGQTTEKSQAAKGRNSDQAADKKSSDSHSGIGRQDGDKDSKEAEQLKAMGKLAEIIGKRSANLTGDIVVENSSGKQQLKTEYSQRVGHHADLGGEINRDDIPLMYQQYVREYMEQVHKQAKAQ